MIGATLGHYLVLSRIGAGGMGEVYRATDTKLGRDVALKVLPAAMSADADRLSRFSAKPRPSPRSTTPTSSRSTQWKTPAACIS